VAAGTTAKREELPKPPPPPAKPVANDQRIKETVQAGMNYHTVLKVGIQCRVEDSDWGAKLITNLTYVGEFVVDRRIESNDGKRVVEVRHFVEARNVKVVSEVEQLKIDFGPAGVPILVALELYAPGSGAAFATTTPVVEAVFGAAADVMLKDATAKAFGRVDSLSGKKVRIVYVDGIGVESVTPIDCGLTEDERDFVFSTAVLSDCHILPELKTKPGEFWKVDGAEFAGLFDPTWRGTPTGDVTIVRDPNQSINGQPHAVLKVSKGLITLNGTDAKSSRVGTFTPSGKLTYNLTDNFVDSAKLEGKMKVERMSRDHILFPATFKSTPSLTVDYSCRIQP
jgi:hypothetical protein